MVERNMSQRGSRRKAVTLFAHRRHCAASIGTTPLRAQVHRIAVVVRCDFPDDHRSRPGPALMRGGRYHQLVAISGTHDLRTAHLFRTTAASFRSGNSFRICEHFGKVSCSVGLARWVGTLPHVRVTFTSNINCCVVFTSRAEIQRYSRACLGSCPRSLLPFGLKLCLVRTALHQSGAGTCWPNIGATTQFLTSLSYSTVFRSLRLA